MYSMYDFSKEGLVYTNMYFSFINTDIFEFNKLALLFKCQVYRYLLLSFSDKYFSILYSKVVSFFRA